MVKLLFFNTDPDGNINFETYNSSDLDCTFPTRFRTTELSLIGRSLLGKHPQFGSPSRRNA
jgi:hypothetical protein